MPTELPKQLTLLEELRSKAKEPGSQVDCARFDGLHVLFIQHLLGPFVSRLSAMCSQGMDPDRAWFVDIPYSTNREVRRHVTELAGDRLAVTHTDPLARYAPAQLGRVEQAVRRIADRLGDDRLLVIDDGAYFSRVLSKLTAEDDLVGRFEGRTHIVEQTTRGHRALFGDLDGSGELSRDCEKVPHRVGGLRQVLEKIKAPVVSIARCKTKTYFEGPVIGAAVGRAVVTRLAQHGIDLTRLDRIGLIGFGTVGREVFRRLTKRLPDSSIDVIERDSGKHEEIEIAGGRPLLQLPGDGRYQLLLGCTGYASFDLEDRTCLSEKATLVSCSSAAVEFNRHRFIEKAEERPDDEFEIHRPQPGSNDIRATVSFTDGYQNIDFLHAGFPINFDGEIEHIPYRYIQVTHALLLAAAMQVVRSKEPDLCWIRSDTDDWVLNQALDSLE